MSTGPTINRGGSKQDYQTDPLFIEAVKKRFGSIDADLAASEENKQACAYYDEKQNSLNQPWHDLSGILWLNPPFDNIAPWASKCAAESALGAPPILFLTPASVGSNWFKQWVMPSAVVLALNGRLTFVGQPTAYPKDCCLSVFWRGLTGFQTWTWK